MSTTSAKPAGPSSSFSAGAGNRGSAGGRRPVSEGRSRPHFRPSAMPDSGGVRPAVVPDLWGRCDGGGELRQLRYFLQVVGLGIKGKARAEAKRWNLGAEPQISRLEGKLAKRLLQRMAAGVVPTDAGNAFWRQEQLAIRKADDAIHCRPCRQCASAISISSFTLKKARRATRRRWSIPASSTYPCCSR